MITQKSLGISLFSYSVIGKFFLYTHKNFNLTDLDFYRGKKPIFDMCSFVNTMIFQIKLIVFETKF